MELINLAWHVGAVVFGVWGMWIGLQSARDKALLREAVLPLLLDGADTLSKSRFVRAVRYFEMREIPLSLKGKVKVDLGSIGGVKRMTPGWEVRQLRILFQIFQIFKAAKGLDLAVIGQSQDSEKRSGGESREGIMICGSTVDAKVAAVAIAARLRQQSSVCLRLLYRPGPLEGGVGGASAVSEVYWELADPD